MSGIRIAHLINPVKVGKDRDLHWQQPITYESMRVAKEFYDGDVEQVACFYPEDESIVPDDFIKTDPLTQSTLDGGFKIVRKLPYFKEMLDKLYETSDADYFIQTNADICLMPHFYGLVKTLIDDNHDSFVITKRILPEETKNLSLSAMYSHIGNGHAGHDCFVFRRELYPKMDIGNIIMGTPWSETTLITNMVRYAKNFTAFLQAHATFHIGDRRIWINHDYDDYRSFNTNEFGRVLRKFSRRNKKILKHPVIRNQLKKLKMEVKNYSRIGEVYSEDCLHLIQ
jgi:hypothetical protein